MKNGGMCMRERKGRMTLVNRLIMFVLVFCLMLVFQTGVENYQKHRVLEPMEQRTANIQAISQFLNDLENGLRLLKNYRWDYGDKEALVTSIRENQRESAMHLSQVQSGLEEVSEQQYLLANAAKISYTTYTTALDEIVSHIQAGEIDGAATLYYSKAEPCGTYLRQYAQQLLERAILDNQSEYIRMTRMNDKLDSTRKLLNTACLVLGAIVIMSLLILINSVREIAGAAQEISAGNLDVKDLDESMEDEIGYTARAFNEMKRSMKRQVQLLSERTELEKEKMQLLRSQINPHFLFNTLNVVMYTARQEEAFKTAELLSSMSQLFRYALGSNEVEVTLAREVHIVKEFVKLQQIRFGNRVNLCWKVSPEVLLTETLVPSFVLQPLVENAFKHGIVPKEDGGVVNIRIFSEEETLYIRVEDNGIGMDEATLCELKKKLENPTIKGEHIGVCNVAARLRMREGAGFSLDSKEAEGTMIEMYMPLKLVEEEELDDDSDINC